MNIDIGIVFPVNGDGFLIRTEHTYGDYEVYFFDEFTYFIFRFNNGSCSANDDDYVGL